MLTQSVHSTILKLDGTVIRGFTSLTGGVDGALDKLEVDGTLSNTAFGVVDNAQYTYSFNATSTAVVSVPNIIAPLNGIGRWELIVKNEITTNPIPLNVMDMLAGSAGLAVRSSTNTDAGVDDFFVSTGCIPVPTIGNLIDLGSKHSPVNLKAAGAGAPTFTGLLAVVSTTSDIFYAQTGRLLKWNGVDAWVVVAPVLNSQTAGFLTVFNDEVYFATNTNGRLHKWNGVDAWVEVAPQSGALKCAAVILIRGAIWSITTATAGIVTVLKWNGIDAWVVMGTVAVSSITSCVEIGSTAYIGTTTYLVVIHSDDTIELISNVTSGIVFTVNNKLYMVELDKGKVSNIDLVDYTQTTIIPELFPHHGWMPTRNVLVHGNKVYVSIYCNVFEIDFDLEPIQYKTLGVASSLISWFTVFNNELYSLNNNGELFEYVPRGWRFGIFNDKIFVNYAEDYFYGSKSISATMQDVCVPTIYTMSVQREKISKDGVIDVYINNKLFESFTIDASTPSDFVSTDTMYAIGQAFTGQPVLRLFSYLFGNLALTQTEVNQITNNELSSFRVTRLAMAPYISNFSAGTDGWTGNGSTVAGNVDGISGKDDVLQAYASSMLSLHHIQKTSIFTGYDYGNLANVKASIFIPSTNTTVKGCTVAGIVRNTLITIPIVLDEWNEVSWITAYLGFNGILLSMTDDSGNRVFAGAGLITDDLMYVKDVSVRPVGFMVEYLSSKLEPYQAIDNSRNALHGLAPATATLMYPKNTFEIKGITTWAGTHEAQHICGVNQTILPNNCYIESIIGVISGTTIEDIVIGDGVDVDRWVAITTGLAAGTVNFTLANRISDGTNRKLVVDPDANFTGSISWTVKGIIL